jgi:hypothetical protein
LEPYIDGTQKLMDEIGMRKRHKDKEVSNIDFSSVIPRDMWQYRIKDAGSIRSIMSIKCSMGANEDTDGRLKPYAAIFSPTSSTKPGSPNGGAYPFHFFSCGTPDILSSSINDDNNHNDLLKTFEVSSPVGRVGEKSTVKPTNSGGYFNKHRKGGTNLIEEPFRGSFSKQYKQKDSFSKDKHILNILDNSKTYYCSAKDTIKK